MACTLITVVKSFLFTTHFLYFKLFLGAFNFQIFAKPDEVSLGIFLVLQFL